MEQFPSVTHDPPPSAYRDPFSVGEVLGTSFSIFFRNLPAFLLMAVLIYSPLFVYAMTTNPLDMTMNEIVWMGIILALGGLVLQNLLTAAVTYGVVEQMAGRHAGVGKSMAVGLRCMLPTFGLFIVMMICIALGFLALFIPGLIVMCMLYVAVPALVIEQNGIGRALSRSAHLTKGYRWSMFALVILMRRELGGRERRRRQRQDRRADDRRSEPVEAVHRLRRRRDARDRRARRDPGLGRVRPAPQREGRRRRRRAGEGLRVTTRGA
jgi:hypothetical protein